MPRGRWDNQRKLDVVIDDSQESFDGATPDQVCPDCTQTPLFFAPGFPQPFALAHLLVLFDTGATLVQVRADLTVLLQRNGLKLSDVFREMDDDGSSLVTFVEFKR